MTATRPVILFEYGEDLGNGEISTFGFAEEPEQVWVQWKEDGLDPAEEREAAENAIETFEDLTARFPGSAQLRRGLANAREWLADIEHYEAASAIEAEAARDRRVAAARAVLAEEGAVGA